MQVSTNRRIALNGPLHVVFVSGHARGQGVVENISLGGLFLRSPMLPREGASIDASIQTPYGRRFSVHGVVKWNTAETDEDLGTCGFGVHVTRPSVGFLGFVDGALLASRDEGTDTRPLSSS